VLGKADVAKYALLWDMRPYQACKSKEIVAVTYFSGLREDTEVKIDGKYYRNIVSLYLLYSYVNNYLLLILLFVPGALKVFIRSFR